MKPTQAMKPATFADGGKVKAFAGKNSKAEEVKEAKDVRSGKVTPKQYAAKEKKEGDTKSMTKLVAVGKSLKSGKVSPQHYGKTASKG